MQIDLHNVFSDLLQCAWLTLVCGVAYASVVFQSAIFGRKHPLKWPLDLQMLVAGFKASLGRGNLTTLRMSLGFMAHPWLHPGLSIQRFQPPGCETCYWLSLSSSSSSSSSSSDSDSSSSRDKCAYDVVLCYVHGGAFIAGHPLMCAATFKRWMTALAHQGLHCKVLCIGYPLAPERPFPAAVASTAAVFAWVGRQFPAGSGTTLIALGDSAGGNIVPSALAALKDHLQSKQPAEPQQVAAASSTPAAAAAAGVTDPGTTTPTGDTAATAVAVAAASSTPAAAATAAGVTAAPAGDSSKEATGLTGLPSNGSSCALTAAIEAHLFADLHNRLTVMDALTANSNNSSNNSSSSSTGTHSTTNMPANSNGSSSAASGSSSNIRMPSAIILVSPATDVSPTACFRTKNKQPQPQTHTAANTTTAATHSETLPTAASAAPTATAPTAAATTAASAAAALAAPQKPPHYDYLPENLESGGMASYTEHHEHLCGTYASPVHLKQQQLQGLCGGRWLLLSGGVELLHPDIERFAHKLRAYLGPSRVVFHVEPQLPHSWAILPIPSLADQQQVVARFIAAEHAATVAAAQQHTAMRALGGS